MKSKRSGTANIKDGNKFCAQKIRKRQKVFIAIRNIPYFVGDEKTDRSCITKHLLLSEALEKLGLKVRFYECQFRWKDLGLPQKLLKLFDKGHVSKHIYLKVFIPETGKYVAVDATWNKALNKNFIVNTWTGFSDTNIGVPCIGNTSIIKRSALISELQKRLCTPEKQQFVDSFNDFYSNN